MKINLITEDREFHQLEEAWQNLQSLDEESDITMTWEWIRTWWEVYNQGISLAFVVAREGDEVIGIAPFVRKEIRHFCFLSYKRLNLAASCEEVKDKTYSCYLNLLSKKDRERDVIEGIFEYLCHSAEDCWDEILLPYMKKESRAVPILRGLQNKFPVTVSEVENNSCPYALLPGTYEEYLKQLGKSTRKQIRRDTRSLNRLGNAEFKVAETEEEVEAAKRSLIGLHQERWTQKGFPGSFSSDKFRAFHAKFIRTAFSNGWLNFGTLSVNKNPIACLYTFIYRGKIYVYMQGTEISDLGYGTIAHAHAITKAISDGVREYDLLIGTHEYKNSLANNKRKIVTIRISKKTLKERLYLMLNLGKKRLKGFKKRFLKS